MNITILQDVIYDWITSVTPDPVIWAYPNAPRPTPSVEVGYFILNITNIIKVNHDIIEAPDENGISEIFGIREFTLSIKRKGINALNEIEILRSSLEQPIHWEKLALHDIALVDTLGIMDTTSLYSSVFEGEATLDVLLRTSSTVFDDVSTIEEVEVDGEEGNRKTHFHIPPQEIQRRAKAFYDLQQDNLIYVNSKSTKEIYAVEIPIAIYVMQQLQDQDWYYVESKQGHADWPIIYT